MSRFLAVYEPVEEGFIDSVVETAKKVIQAVLKILKRIAELIKNGLDKLYSILSKSTAIHSAVGVHGPVNMPMTDTWVPVKLRILFLPMKKYGITNKFLRSDDFDTQDEIYEERQGYYEKQVENHRHGPTLNEEPPPVRAITDKLRTTYALATQTLERKNSEFSLDVNEYRLLKPIDCEINKSIVTDKDIKLYTNTIAMYKGYIKQAQKSLNSDLKYYQETVERINRNKELTNEDKAIFVKYVMAKINNCRISCLYEQSRLELMIGDFNAIVNAVS